MRTPQSTHLFIAVTMIFRRSFHRMTPIAQRLMVAVLPEARIGRPLHRHDVIDALRRCRAPITQAVLAQRVRAPERLRVLLPSPAIAACVRCCACRIELTLCLPLVRLAPPAMRDECRASDLRAWAWRGGWHGATAARRTAAQAGSPSLPPFRSCRAPPR